MNEVSAASAPFFTLAPLPLCAPLAELVVSEDGHLFIQLTLTVRCLPKQDIGALQFGLKKHAVQAEHVDLEVREVGPGMVLEEIPSSLVTGSEAYPEIAADVEVPGRACPFACRLCYHQLALESVSECGPFGMARLADPAAALKEEAVHINELSDREDLHVRVPHHSEAASTLQAICCCRDRVMRVLLPVDGDKLCYGETYLFHARTRDTLLWSRWTDFSKPLYAGVHPPEPVADAQPLVNVEMLGWPRSTAQTMTADQDLKLRISWPVFEGRMREIEYRVFLWTLSQDQKRQAAGVNRFTELKCCCTLPPILGTQMFVINSSNEPTSKEPTEGVELPPDVAPAHAAPRQTVKTVDSLSPRHRCCGEAPHVIANIRPFEAVPRLNATRRARQNGKDLSPLTLGDLEVKPSCDVSVNLPPAGHGFVFAVEAKYCNGTCGNVGEWSAPLFSKLIGFDYRQHQFTLDVSARYGAMLFKGSAVTASLPEEVHLQVKPMSYADEHRDLPAAMGLLAPEDPWPLNNTGAKLLIRSKGRTKYADVETGDLSTNHLPESRPLHDDDRP